VHLARALGLCVLPLLLASALPGAAQPDEAQEQGAAPGPVHVGVGLHVLSVGNYDPNKGTYVLDFYLILAWDAAQAPEGFAPDRFEFMNGRATSKDLIFDGREGEARELWYRVQASLYAQPRFRDYPFDTQHIRLQMEDAVRPAAELVYVPMEGRVGLDERVNVAGWEVRSQAVDVVRSAYPFGEEYSRLRFDVEVERPALGVGLRSFVPPTAFVAIAGIGFFLHVGKVANRLTLATSMVISAVGFHVSQTIGLPSLPNLTLFDEVMVSVYLFLACSVGVATLIAVNEDVWKREGLSRRVNRAGAAATILLPALALVMLRLV